MKGLTAKIISLVTASTLLLSSLIGILSISMFQKNAKEQAEDNLLLTAKVNAEELDLTLYTIEQSVDSLSQIALTTIADFEKFKTSSAYVTECTEALEAATMTLAQNTKGAMTAYVRYNPEFTEPDSGIFLTKTGDEFEASVPTDFSMYDPDDMEHVGWYYIPVNAGKPVWMDPYMNENINVYMISYVVPLYINGESVGIVGMDIDFSGIQDMVNSIGFCDSGYAYLTNVSDTLIVHKDYESGTALSEADSAAAELLGNSEKANTAETVGSQVLVYIPLHNGMKLALTVPGSELFAGSRNMIVKIAIAIIVMLVIVCAAASLVGNQMAKPIRELTHIIQNTAAFNFQSSENGDKLCRLRDETGEMARAVRKMRGELRNMINLIGSSCDNLNGNIDNLLTASTHVNDMTENNSAVTQELSAAMMQTSDGTEKIHDTILHLQDSALFIRQLSQESRQISIDLMEGARKLSNATSDATSQTQDMYEHVKKDTEEAIEHSKAVSHINQLTEAIAGISEQTNLLALNASIEAARAGEAGRGFSVVATEISTLANQTNQTVEDINSTVDEVYTAVADMSKCIDTLMNFINKKILPDYDNFNSVGKQYEENTSAMEESMNQVNTSIQELVEALEQISGTVGDINDMVQESSEGIHRIAQETIGMAEVTGNNSQLAEKSKDTIRELFSVVEKFKI